MDAVREQRGQRYLKGGWPKHEGQSTLHSWRKRNNFVGDGTEVVSRITCDVELMVCESHSVSLLYWFAFNLSALPFFYYCALAFAPLIFYAQVL
jgi:hypothetical protein